MNDQHEHGEARDERDTPDARFDSLETLRGLASAHSLDALEGDERAAFERAADESPELRDEVRAYGETAAQLAESTEPVEPPSALRARLMSQLDGLPQQAPDAAAAGDPVPSTPPPAQRDPAPDAGHAGPAETAAHRRWFRRPGAIVAAAAAAVLLIAGAILAIGWSGPNGWGAQRDMAAIAAAPDVQTATHDVAGGGEATLYWSAAEGRSAVVVKGLPDVGADATYELWYIDDGGAASAGTFDVRGDETWRVLDGAFAPGIAVGVTVEPEGGSPQPTTEPIVVIPT